jgi:hypothetical protein
MAYSKLDEAAMGLSEASVAEVLDFIQFLKAKDDRKKSNIIFDELKGGLIYMADDFDETPDCFKEYM